MTPRLLAPLVGMIVISSSFAFAQSLPGGDAAVDCTQFDQANSREPIADEKAIRECMMRGFDPPTSLRPNEGRSSGVTLGGAGGFSFDALQAPEDSPGARGAPANVTQGQFDFSMGFPPWRGFPCQLPGGIDMCGGGSDSDGDGIGDPIGGGDPTDPGGSGSDVCAANNDTTGTFGEQVPLTSGGTVDLACGGTFPLTTYQMSLNRNPVGLFATEYNSFAYWVYQPQGSSYKLVSQNGARLPSYLCMPDSEGKMVKSVDLRAPLAQLTTYNGDQQVLVVRLAPEDEEAYYDPFSVDPADSSPEKFLVMPIIGGVPQVPPDCARETDYYRTLTSTTHELMVQAAVNPGCENCAGVTSTPTPSAGCDSVTLYPSGTTNTSSGPVVCDGKTQVAVLDRPNLIHAPASSPTIMPIEGRTAYMVSSGPESTLYAQYETLIYLGQSSQSWEFPNGATMKLADGNRLVMSGPAVVSPGSNQVRMSAGGMIQNPAGSTLQTFTAGSIYSPNSALPWLVKMERNLKMPQGYMVPTQPNPFVRLPVDGGE